MTQLVANLDAIHETAEEITGIDLSGTENKRVIIRKAPSLPPNSFTPINEDAVIRVSTQNALTHISNFAISGGMPSWMIDRSLEGLFETLNPALGFPSWQTLAQKRRILQGILGTLAQADLLRCAFDCAGTPSFPPSSGTAQCSNDGAI